MNDAIVDRKGRAVKRGCHRMSKKKTVTADKTKLSPPVTPVSVNDTDEGPPNAETSASSLSCQKETSAARRDRLLEQFRASGEEFLNRYERVADPSGPFADAVIECSILFEKEHYRGCMALADHLLRAMVRFVDQGGKRKKIRESPGLSRGDSLYRKILERLLERQLLDEVMCEMLKQFLVDKAVVRQLDVYPQVTEDLRKTAEKLLSTVLSFEKRIKERHLLPILP